MFHDILGLIHFILNILLKMMAGCCLLIIKICGDERIMIYLIIMMIEIIGIKDSDHVLHDTIYQQISNGKKFMIHLTYGDNEIDLHSVVIIRMPISVLLLN